MVYKELEKHLNSIGYTACSYDRGIFFENVHRKGKCVASSIVSVHVDDIASVPSSNPEGEQLEKEFWDSMEKKWPGIKGQKGPHYKHLSWNIFQDPKTKEIHKTQRDCIIEIVKASGYRIHRNYHLLKGLALSAQHFRK